MDVCAGNRSKHEAVMRLSHRNSLANAGLMVRGHLARDTAPRDFMVAVLVCLVKI